MILLFKGISRPFWKKKEITVLKLSICCKIDIYLHLGDSSQHATQESTLCLNLLGDLPLSEKTSSIVEFQDISAQDACENGKFVAPDPLTDSLPFQYMSAAAAPQGTSSPTHEDQKTDLDQITEPLPCQNLSAAEPQEPSSSICEDQKMTAPDQVTKSLPSQDLTTEPSSPVCEDPKMAGPDQIMESLSFRDTSPAAEPQETEDQIMSAPDQITKLLPSQDTSTTAEPRGTSSPACEDRIMADPDQIMEPLPSHDTNVVSEAQVTSQVVAEDRELGSVKEPSTLQPQVYSSQTVTQNQEMEAGDTVEASRPSLATYTAIQPESSSWHPSKEQKKQEMAAGDSASLPCQKRSSSIEIQGSSVMSISEESVAASLQSSDITLLASSVHVGNISSPVQDVRALTQPASVDMPGEILNIISCCVTWLVTDLIKGNLGKRCVLSHTKMG